MYDAAVVGGGVAGLTVAYRLKAAGWQVTCLEADTIAGGSVRTDRVSGLLCERGAQNVLEGTDGPVARLSRDLGIEAGIEYPREKGNYLAWGGHLHVMPRQLHRVISTAGMARAVRGLLLAKQRSAKDESIAVWARRRFGEQFALRIIDPLVSGICAGDPERISLDAVFPDLGKLERKHRSLLAGAFGNKSAGRCHYTFRNGMGVLTEALAARLGSSLRTGLQAIAVSADGSDAYRIDTRDAAGGGAPSIRSRNVVLAAPATAAAGLVGTLDPELERLLGSIESVPAVSASLSFAPTDFSPHPPKGYGVMRPHCDGARLLGCLFPSSAFEGAAPPGVIHLRILAGGRRDPEAYSLEDRALLEMMRRELGSVLGLRSSAEPSIFHVVRHRHGFPQYETGHLDRVRKIEMILGRSPRVYLTGNSYYGLSVSKVVEGAERLSARMLGAHSET